MRAWAGVLVVLMLLLLGGAVGCGSDDSAATEEAAEERVQEEETSPEDETAEAKAHARKVRRANQREAREQLSAERREQAAAREKRAATGGWTGVNADNYETARVVCESFPKQQIAQEYGLPSTADELEIAEAYAGDYREAFQQANFEGCLAGLGIE